jgi:branched-chain amino acid transport system substrate-binding protein
MKKYQVIRGNQHRLLSIAWSFVVLVSVACNRPTSGEIRIGAILPLTGRGAGLGHSLQTGLLLASKQINQAGGIAGMPVRLLVEDTESEPKNAASAFKKLTEIDQAKIIFTVMSSQCLALKPLAESAGVLLFADCAHPEVTKDTTYVLRHSNIANRDAEVMAKAVRAAGYDGIAVLFQRDDWGVAFTDTFTGLMSGQNARFVSEEFLPDQSDLRPQLTRLKAKEPQALLIVSFGPAIGLAIKQARELGYKGAIYTSIGFVLTPEARTIAGESAEGIFYQTYEAKPAFAREYQQAFGEEAPLLGQMTYTDMELIKQAIEQTGSHEPREIAAYIKGLGAFAGRFEKVAIQTNGDIPVQTIVAKEESIALE